MGWDRLMVFLKFYISIKNNVNVLNWFESYNHHNDIGSTSNSNFNESINGIFINFKVEPVDANLFGNWYTHLTTPPL